MQPVSKHITQSEIHATNLHTNPTFEKKKWYALYTRPHHEKKVYEQLQKERIEAYLPLQTTIRQWSDRKKKVSVPLFSCYVFVQITMKDYYRVLNLDGIVRYITFEGKAVAIPENQILLIRNLLAQDLEVLEFIENFSTGTQVEIKVGPFTGIIGELVEHAGKYRVIIHIEEINKSIWVNVPIQYLA